jgi:hypothetical protein
VGVARIESAVGEIVASGVATFRVAEGVSCEGPESGIRGVGAGVSTSTLNVQPEARRLNKRRKASNFFMVEPFEEHLINFRIFDLTEYRIMI